MLKRFTNFYHAYQLADLPSDLLLAIRTRQLVSFARNGFNVTHAMTRGHHVAPIITLRKKG